MYEAMQIGMFVLLIVVVVVLAVLLVKCKQNEKFCGTCQGMSNKVCTNRPTKPYVPNWTSHRKFTFTKI